MVQPQTPNPIAAVIGSGSRVTIGLILALIVALVPMAAWMSSIKSTLAETAVEIRSVRETLEKISKDVDDKPSRIEVTSEIERRILTHIEELRKGSNGK